MPAMPSFIRECGMAVVGSNACVALRMRVSMSEIGSVILYQLPACLRHAGDQPGERVLAEGQAGAAELAEEAVPAAGLGAAVDRAHRAGVPGQFGQGRVILLLLQFGAEGGELKKKKDYAAL